MSRSLSIGVVAPSFVVSPVELGLAAEALKGQGFRVHLHPQCLKKHRYFAGTDAERAQAIFDYAFDTAIDVLWCARGGYGAARILSLLEEFTKTRGIPPKKLLVGYSDATVLHEYVRARWSWSTLHAPMPGLREFLTLKPAPFGALLALVQGKPTELLWESKRLKFLAPLAGDRVVGELTGGNLSVLAALAGTRFAPRMQDRLIFLEDVSEGFYRIDRYVHQLKEAGSFHRVKGIILGTFADCQDTPARGLKKVPSAKAKARVLLSPRPSELQPLRPALTLPGALQCIFGDLGQELGIPVAYGLPVGHGGGIWPLPLGGAYALGADGRLTLTDWDWRRREKE